MKKENKHIRFKMNRARLYLLFLLTVVFFACKPETPVAEKFEVEVSVQFPDGYKGNLDGIAVKVVGTSDALEKTAITDQTGKVSFTLEAGLYKITASQVTEEFALNGTLDATVSAKKSLTVKLLASSLKGGLVIKEFYYSGSKTNEDGNYYSDQFTEIYNNSDEVIYLDGLCMGVIFPPQSSTPSKWVDNKGDLLPKLPFGFYLCHFPGSGKEYPLQPRSSVVIAQDAIDHKTDPLGNPASPVNLGKVNWELYVGDINKGKDADNPAIPNLTVFYATATTMFDVLYPVGGPAFALFRFPEGVNPKDFAGDEKNLSPDPVKPGRMKFLMVPKEYIIDAVECVRPEENKRYKRLHAELDAGYVFCKESYNSKSVRRKVKQIIDGKVIYQDTNNSSNDFLGDQVPTPGVHPSQID